MEEISGIQFELDKNILVEIYNNSVYPTQGTRPVFSSIHMIFSNILIDITFWCIENDIRNVSLSMSSDLKSIIAFHNNNSKTFPIFLEMNEKKKKMSLNTKTLIAVHEAGHAYTYAKLHGIAPTEVRINAASYEGGYMLPTAEYMVETGQQIKDEICILLAGTAAEEVIFGSKNRSSGSQSDIIKATVLASNFIRKYGFGKTLGVINSASAGDISWNTNITETNNELEDMIRKEFDRAKQLIKDDIKTFKTTR